MLDFATFTKLAGSLAPELAATTEPVFDCLFPEVLRETPNEVWGDKDTLAQFYLICHMLTFGKRKGRVGGLTGETVGSLSRSYGGLSTVKGALDLTSYGVEFQRLRRQVVTSPLYVG